MARLAVIKTGGKQYLVKMNDEIIVNYIPGNKEKDTLDLETLSFFDEDGGKVEMGSPALASSVKAEIISHLKGDKIRVAKFHAKVRYRRVTGFRPMLTKLKITKV